MSLGGGGGADDTDFTGIGEGVEDNRLAITKIYDTLLLLIELTNPLRYPLAWIVSLFSGLTIWQARDRLSASDNPPEIEALNIIFIEYLYNQLLLPIAITLFNAGEYAIGLVVGFFDQLAAVPFFVSRPITATIFSVFGTVTGTIREINLQVAESLSVFGLAAPIVANGILVLELGVIVTAGWILIRSIDVPFIDISGYILSVTRPFRRAFDLVFR